MTDSDLPDPLVPPDVDLRGYEFMPLFGDRMLKSETWIGATAEEKLAAIRLWWQSFAHEFPAASLPDNDQLLADYAGYGVMVKAWRKVKPQAMRGFVLCNDGRLYHRFLADVVIKAWSDRQIARAKGINGAAKRWGKPKHPEPIAQASQKIAGASKSDAPVKKIDSKGEERKEDLGVNNTTSTRGSGGQDRLNFPSKSTPISDVEGHRERARLAVQTSGVSEDEARAALLAKRVKQ